MDDVKHLGFTVELLTIRMQDMNPTSAKVPNGTIQVVPSYYFLVGPDFLTNDKFIKALFHLWTHPFKTSIFTVRTLSSVESGVTAPLLEKISFLCHFCNFLRNSISFAPDQESKGNASRNSFTKDRQKDKPGDRESPHRYAKSKNVLHPFDPVYLQLAYSPRFVTVQLDIPLMCPNILTSGCRVGMDTIEQRVTQSGRNISYWFPPFLRFQPNLIKLRNMVKRKTTFYDTIEENKPHLDEVIAAVLIENMNPEKISDRSDSDIVSPWIGAFIGTSAAFQSAFVRADGFKFITCDGYLNGFSLNSYLKPFQFRVWIAVNVSIISSCVVISIMVNCLKTHYRWFDITPENNSELSFSSLFFTVFALLMETDVVIGVVTKSKKFRWFMFSWLFGSLILSTAYKGDNISTVIVPQFSTKVFQYFDQLIGFTLYSNGWDFAEFANRSPGRRSYSNTSSKVKTIQSSLSMQFERYFSWKYGRQKFDEIDAEDNPDFSFLNSQADATLLKLYKSLLVTPKGNYKTDEGISEILSLLGSCDKSAIVVDQDNTDLILQKLKNSKNNSNGQNFYAGSDTLLPQPYAWSFSKSGGSYFPRRAQILFHSGIISLWERLILRKNQLSSSEIDDNRWSEQKPISLQSNIITIFIILLALCFICFLVLLVEIVVDSLYIIRKRQNIAIRFRAFKLYWYLIYLKVKFP